MDRPSLQQHEERIALGARRLLHGTLVGTITVAATAASTAPSASAPAPSVPAASSMPDTASDPGADGSPMGQPSVFLALVALAGLGMMVALRLRRS